MQIVLHEKFLPEARLPFSIVKCSVKSRKIMAEKQFKNFYKEINHYWNGKYCSVDILRETLDKQLSPNKINYVILNEENQKFAGSHGCSVKVTPGENGEINLNHTGYKFLLPLDSTKNNILNKYTALHEARHFFDHLYNPKYSLIRCGKSSGSTAGPRPAEISSLGRWRRESTGTVSSGTNRTGKIGYKSREISGSDRPFGGNYRISAQSGRRQTSRSSGKRHRLLPWYRLPGIG